MNNIFTKENVTFVLSVIGSFGTLFFWLKSYFDNRVNISITVVGKYQPIIESLVLYVMFENRSHTTTSINQVTIKDKANSYNCVLIPTKVLTRTTSTNGNITSQHDYFSLQLPIVLNPLCGVSGYLYFEDCQPLSLDFSNELIVEVCTNRGKRVQKILQPNSVSSLRK